MNFVSFLIYSTRGYHSGFFMKLLWWLKPIFIKYKNQLDITVAEQSANE